MKTIALFLDFDNTFIPYHSQGVIKLDEPESQKENSDCYKYVDPLQKDSNYSDYYMNMVKGLEQLDDEISLNKINLKIFIVTRGVTNLVYKFLKKQDMIDTDRKGFRLIKGVFGSFDLKSTLLKSSYNGKNKIQIKYLGKDVSNEKNIKCKEYVNIGMKWCDIKCKMIEYLINHHQIDFSYFDDDDQKNVDCVAKNLPNIKLLNISNTLFKKYDLFDLNYGIFREYKKLLEIISKDIETNKVFV